MNLLENYGFRTTPRAWAAAPTALSSTSSDNGSLSRRPLSIVSDFSERLLPGYFIPSIYLPTFARSLSLSPSTGTLHIALVNAAGVFSTISMGMLIDRFHVTTAIQLSTVGAAISDFLFWGFSTDLPLLYVFRSFTASLPAGS